jgi:putative component of membrane protein insertase Oxa1/YidC/SpoIIIJ protein YidD
MPYICTKLQIPNSICSLVTEDYNINFSRSPQCYFTVYKHVTLIKIWKYFPNIYSDTFQAYKYMALPTLTPHTTTCPSCCEYWLQEIKKHKDGVSSNGIMRIPSFVIIGHLVQKLKWQAHK